MMEAINAILIMFNTTAIIYLVYCEYKRKPIIKKAKRKVKPTIKERISRLINKEKQVIDKKLDAQMRGAIVDIFDD